MPLIETFVNTSREIGTSKASVQGGGGNTSIKLDNSTMLIKASGTLLKDMTLESGYVVVEPTIVAHNLTHSLSENDASTLLRSSIKQSSPEGRPSMETGFHAVLGPVVIHTHSVYVNCASCVENGEALAHDIMASTDIKTEWIPYFAPGLQLSLAIKDRIAKKPETQAFILQNHGVIVTADTCEDAHALHNQIESTFKTALKLPLFEESLQLKQISDTVFEFTFDGADSLKLDHVLFPDQAIYLTQDIVRIQGGFRFTTTQQKAIGMAETLLAKRYIEAESKKSGHVIRTLSEDDVALILNMPSEKYRKMVIQ